MIMNEKIKASEVQLTGLNEEDLGIVSTKAALRMAKELQVDLICLSMTSSPPPCKLVKQADFKNVRNQQKKMERKKQIGLKVKEIRFSAMIEEHDYETKKRQAERILTAGDGVQLTVSVENKKNQTAKDLAERLAKDLSNCGRQERGIQISGKQVRIIVHPL